mmetsp:Transcript_26008/g.68471  ORF Transcript_26008/g.68471 Transcript_26008/m.68471 type:complete len:214 (+) Transcript_26008:478-1119(+)
MAEFSSFVTKRWMASYSSDLVRTSRPPRSRPASNSRSMSSPISGASSITAPRGSGRSSTVPAGPRIPPLRLRQKERMSEGFATAQFSGRSPPKCVKPNRATCRAGKFVCSTLRRTRGCSIDWGGGRSARSFLASSMRAVTRAVRTSVTLFSSGPQSATCRLNSSYLKGRTHLSGCCWKRYRGASPFGHCTSMDPACLRRDSPRINDVATVEPG